MTHAARATDAPTSGGLSLYSAAPVLVFLAVNRAGGLRWAVVAATAASLAVVVDRRRRNLPLGRFMPIVTAAVILRGLAGVLTGSETVYFGLGIAAKYGAGAALLASVALGAPLARRAAPHLVRIPQEMADHRLFHSTMGIVTAIAGLYYLLSATFDVWLFRRSSVEGFVFVRFIANWPLSAAALVAIFAVLQVRLPQIPGAPPLASLIEERQSAPLPPKRSDEPPTNGSA